LERGTKVHGFRGYFLMNEGVRLSFAVWNYARQFFAGEGISEVIAPSIVRKEYFYGTGHLPNDAEDLFETQDGDYLSGTAEVPMMAFHSGEILKKEDLPKRYLAFSPCFRREAGSHGKDTKGLVRVHEFYKFEQLILCEGRHEESERLHEEITLKSESFIESLGLPYRRLNVCSGDLSASKVKQYELEIWMPFQGKYREIGSSSYYHDFQTRRFNIRYDDNGAKRYAHSLNNTAIPTPRILAAIVENNQREDGKISVPTVLRPFLGGAETIG
jgi:seryl-tRNA synthetase